MSTAGKIILLLAISIGISFGLVSGIIYAICSLMNWQFSLRIVTAIWLACLLINICFGRGGK